MNVSIYSKLTDEELESLHVQLTEKYGNDLHDGSKSEEERKLTKLVEKIVSPEKQEEEAYSVREFVKEYLCRKLKDLVFIEYLVMKKSKDYGTYGEQAVSISFCRNILSVRNDREVTQFDADRLYRILDEFDKRNGNKSVEDYKAFIKDFALVIFGRKYTGVDVDTGHVNKLFDLLGANYYLYGVKRVIFGTVDKYLIGDKNVITFQKEYIRSPIKILSAVATINGNGMIIRQEACEVIFFNKWQKFFSRSKSERKSALRHIGSAILEGLREYVLTLYNAANTSDVLKIKDIFMQNMKDGIVWHEIGHLISFTNMNTIHYAYHYSLTSDFKVGHVLQEALADYAPIRGQQKGAIASFVELALTDTVQATRNFYTYMSDYWFLDEKDEECIGLMTDGIIALAMVFINPDGSVDFDRLAREHEKVYEFILKRFGILCDKLLDVIRNSQFEIDARQLGYMDLVSEILYIIKHPQNEKAVHQFDYSYLEDKINKEFQDSENTSLPEKLPKLETFWDFWDLITEYLKKYSSTGWEQYQNVQIEEAAELEKLIFSEIIKEAGAKYENSLHNYVVERAKEIGILKTLPEIDVMSVVNKVCNTMKMTKAEQEKALAKFTEIMNGKQYDIAVSYEGEKDPFIMVLQEMMLESGYGEIEAGMLIGEYYNPEADIESRRQYITEELEAICDRIESEMYLEIDVLRVNDKYKKIKPMVDKLLHTITFYNGRKLASKINLVKYMPLDDDAMFEIFIPLMRGYMDWNTSQAVWRINQDLRPDEFMVQWTVDKDFLEALACCIST